MVSLKNDNSSQKNQITILLVIQWRSFSITRFLLPQRSQISQIIKNQTELQILGLYIPGGTRYILKTLKELYNAQLFFPIIFTLERESFTPYPDHISIFPMFYSVDRRTTIHQVLAQSLGKDQGNYMVASVDKVRWLSIYLIDSSDIPSISALAKDMAVSFPQIDVLNLCFERLCEIVSFLLAVDDSYLKGMPCMIF